jgi:hypothetical protein
MWIAAPIATVHDEHICHELTAVARINLATRRWLSDRNRSAAVVLGNHLISVRRTEEKDLAGIQENAILGSSCFKNQMARCKSQSILIIAALLSIVTILSNNVNAQTQSSPHNLSAASAKDLFSAIAATVGVAGGLAGLAKFFSDRQEKETREWQKVSIYRVLSENESKPIRFTQIRDSHRAEGGSVNVRRKDLEEKEIRRALLGKLWATRS